MSRYLPKNRGPYAIRDAFARNHYVNADDEQGCIPKGLIRRFSVRCSSPPCTAGQALDRLNTALRAHCMVPACCLPSYAWQIAPQWVEKDMVAGQIRSLL